MDLMFHVKHNHIEFRESEELVNNSHGAFHIQENIFHHQLTI